MTDESEPDMESILAKNPPARTAECAIGTSRHSDHDNEIARLQSIVDLMQMTPRSLIAKIRSIQEENAALQAKLKNARDKIESHLKKHSEGVYVQRNMRS